MRTFTISNSEIGCNASQIRGCARQSKSLGPHTIRDAAGNSGFLNVDLSLPDLQIFRVANLFDYSNICLATHLEDKRVIALIDPTINALYGESIRGYLDVHSIENLVLTLPTRNVNENNKSLHILESLAERISMYQPCGSDILLLIGGGVVLDVGGFLASIYRRGLDYISIPTTLLAVVDAGISPKTAINVAGIKNLLGTIHPPQLVLYDPKLLKSITHLDFCNGITEILKVAIVGSRPMFDYLSETPVHVLKEACFGSRTSNILEDAIELFLNLKWTGPYFGNKPASIRSFGHSFSRELESASNFALSHGQAVSVEMAVATFLSINRGMLSHDEGSRIINCLLHLGLPMFCHECNAENIWKMVFEAKALAGRPFYFPVPTRIGDGAFLDSFTLTELSDAISTASCCNM